jgi:hypothetical protein
MGCERASDVSGSGIASRPRRARLPGGKNRIWRGAILGALSLLALAFPVAAAEPAPAASGSQEAAPARLSYTYGDVSFWRPGAGDWTPAEINTPLAPGDALYSAAGASAEVQIGPRAFVRMGAETQVGLSALEPDYVQFEVRSGRAAVDVRILEPGHTVEVDTPNAAFTIEASGYYRLDVGGDATTFVIRRGGRATISSAAAGAMTLRSGEQVVARDRAEPSVAIHAAPALDAWDRWNYERTDHLIASASTRYVSPQVYGLDELDRYGNWAVEPDYGPVWIPAGVGPDWAPYTVGRWIWDPFYRWTWIDDAPWGWAPCHYGRWVRVRGYWGWAPGPVVAAPIYSPAVVAFFGGPRFSIGVGLGAPAVGWVALGWGEPLVPWWGPVGFIGVPWWGGWRGPRVVNGYAIHRHKFVRAGDIHRYRHAHTRYALGFAREDAFGRGHHRPGRWRDVNPRLLEPVHGRLPVRPVPASLSPRSGHAKRPPRAARGHPVVTRSGRHGAAGRRVAEGRAPAGQGGAGARSYDASAPRSGELHRGGPRGREVSPPSRRQRPATRSSRLAPPPRIGRRAQPARRDSAAPRVESPARRAVPRAPSRDFRQPSGRARPAHPHAAVPRLAPRRGASRPGYSGRNQGGAPSAGVGRPGTRSFPQRAPGGSSRGGTGRGGGHGAHR